MPEGPESHIMADIIGDRLKTSMILSIVDRSGQLINGECMKLPEKVSLVRSEGKRPEIHTNRGVLSFFLSMTGNLSWVETSHTRIVITLAKCKKFKGVERRMKPYYCLYFNDIRKFGRATYYLKDDQYSTYIKSKGVDMLNVHLEDDEFISICRRAPQKWEVCKFLLDPRYISSVGNYIKSEVLYKSRIYPGAKLLDLTDKNLLLMLKYLRRIINKSYRKGGFTLSNYMNPNGDMGEYEPIIYGKYNTDKGEEVHKSIFGDRRKTYWSPEIQTIGKKVSVQQQ